MLNLGVSWHLLQGTPKARKTDQNVGDREDISTNQKKNLSTCHSEVEKEIDSHDNEWKS